jgi:hypothetical protein
VNERVVIEENACNAEISGPREVACGGTWSAPSHPSVAKADVAW